MKALPVHDVDVERVGAEVDDLLAFLGELAEVSGQDGGADEDVFLLLVHEIKFIILSNQIRLHLKCFELQLAGQY